MKFKIKADVYSYGMTLLDVLTLSIYEDKKVEEKLDIIELRYGTKFFYFLIIFKY